MHEQYMSTVTPITRVFFYEDANNDLLDRGEISACAQCFRFWRAPMPHYGNCPHCFIAVTNMTRSTFDVRYTAANLWDRCVKMSPAAPENHLMKVLNCASNIVRPANFMAFFSISNWINEAKQTMKLE
jgi:hypothetical protein